MGRENVIVEMMKSAENIATTILLNRAVAEQREQQMKTWIKDDFEKLNSQPPSATKP